MPRIPIPDDNLRLALVQSLIDSGVLPPFERPAQLDDHHKVGAIESELLSWLRPEHLPRIESVVWEGGMSVQHWIWTYWNGEDSAFSIADLRGIAACTALRELLIWACSDVADLAPLAGMTTLGRLACVGGRVSDLAPLAGMQRLTTLDLGYQRLRDLTPLAGLRGLTRLRVPHNRDVADPSPLLELPALVELDVTATALRDLSFALELPVLGKLAASAEQPLSAHNHAVVTALRRRGVKVRVV